MTKSANRKTYIDFLKILAILTVLFHHTGTDGFVLFTVRRESVFFWPYLFNGIFIKVGVPLFFMASGALLLGKTESLKTVLVRRFLKYFLVMVAASVLQYLYACLVAQPQPLSFVMFFTRLYVTTLANAYWYLYAYLGYLLMLPFLRKIAQGMTAKEALYMVVLYAVMSILPVFEFMIWEGKFTLERDFSIFTAANYVFYPLLGYFADRILDEKHYNRKTMAALSAASVAAIAVCCVLTVDRCTRYNLWQEVYCQAYFNTLIFIPSFTIFFGAKLFFMKHRPKERTSRLITALGGTTFGIYLFENVLREQTRPVFDFLKPAIRTLPACWVWVLAAFAAGSLATFLIKLIPGMKKVL